MLENNVDQINQKTMRNSVTDYVWSNQLTAPEKAALASLGDIKDKAIVDIGVGGGRTVNPLLEISSNYIGLDYVKEMIASCRSQYPGVKFEQADARDLSLFDDASIDLVIFSMNGISMVDHDSRIKILQEVYRILRPGGSFLFSTYNLDSKYFHKIFQFPDFDMSKNALKLLVRGGRFLNKTAVSAINRIRYKRYELHANEYSIINDKCHQYATMLYYISLPNQLKQLCLIGFNADILAFDLDGKEIKTQTIDDSIFYVSRK